MRSWEAAGLMPQIAGAVRLQPIPHLRAADFDPDEPFPHITYFREKGITMALVIAGDPVPSRAGDEKPEAVKRSTINFIRKLKAEMPELSIYAAFDPYRSNIRYELDYLAEKDAAGVSGYFSQPFFDLRLLEIYAEYLEGKRCYWGTTPVLSEKSRAYWESRNRAIFPRNFRPDLYWNIHFGREMIDFCKKNAFHIYLMPIKCDIQRYLEGILDA